MSYVYSRMGSNMAAGPAVATPMVVDLALLLQEINGGMNRDNVLPVRITDSSTWESPVANKVTASHASSNPAAFTLVMDGRRYCENVDVSLSNVQDGMLIISAMSTMRIDDTGNTIVGGLPVGVAFGVEVDGRVVYHTGMMWTVQAPRATTSTPTDVPASWTGGYQVGAGSHTVRCFWDFKYGTPIGAGTLEQLDACQQLETALYVVQARR